MSRRYDTRIGQQLHQGGNTPGESNSIAKWLRQAFAAASSAVAPGAREITRNNPQAQNPVWKNQFIPPEQPLIKDQNQVLGADGAKHPDQGSDGTIGTPGYTQPSTGGGGVSIGGDVAVYGTVDLRPIFARLAYLEQKVADHEYRITLLEKRVANFKWEAPDFSKTIDRIKADIKDLRRRTDVVEDDLNNTIDCP